MCTDRAPREGSFKKGQGDVEQRKPERKITAEKVIAVAIAIAAILIAVGSIRLAHTVASAPETIAHDAVRDYMASSWHPIPNPNPNLDPLEVVSLVLAGFRTYDQPTEAYGLRVAYHFASPGLREALGSRENLATMLATEDFRPLIGHRRVEMGTWSYAGEDRWRIPLIVEQQDGIPAGFLFVLARQRSGEFEGSWMTEGVVRMPLSPRMEAGRDGRSVSHWPGGERRSAGGGADRVSVIDKP